MLAMKEDTPLNRVHSVNILNSARHAKWFGLADHLRPKKTIKLNFQIVKKPRPPHKTPIAICKTNCRILLYEICNLQFRRFSCSPAGAKGLCLHAGVRHSGQAQPDQTDGNSGKQPPALFQSPSGVDRLSQSKGTWAKRPYCKPAFDSCR